MHGPDTDHVGDALITAPEIGAVAVDAICTDDPSEMTGEVAVTVTVAMPEPV
jgi:hypothetical protein